MLLNTGKPKPQALATPTNEIPQPEEQPAENVAPEQPSVAPAPKPTGTSAEFVGSLCQSLREAPVDSETAKGIYNSITSAVGKVISADDLKDIISKLQGASAAIAPQPEAEPQPQQPLAEVDVPGDMIHQKDEISLEEQLLKTPSIKKIIEHLKLTNENGDLAHNVCEAIHVYNQHKNSHPETKSKLAEILSKAKFLPPSSENTLDEESNSFDENNLDESGKKILEVLFKIGNKNQKKSDYEKILQQEKDLTNHPNYQSSLNEQQKNIILNKLNSR